MLRKLKKEADFFMLDGLRKQIQIIYPEDDDEVEIDVRGTRFKRTRMFLMKYKHWPKDFGPIAELFDPKSARYIQPRDDGCVVIDCPPLFMECILSMMQCDDFESRKRVGIQLKKKYGNEIASDKLFQWRKEFISKYLDETH